MVGRIERLLNRAERYLEQGLPLPLTLAAQMIDAGLDVAAIERSYA